MKRRTVSVLLAAMLVLFLFPCAHADQNIPYEIADESMIDEDVYSGTWQTIGKVYDMYVPDGWKVSDPTDVEYASGVLAKICDPTGNLLSSPRTFPARRWNLPDSQSSAPSPPRWKRTLRFLMPLCTF